ALLYEDDTVEFLDCIMDSENNYSGRIVFSDDASGRSRFVYEEFQGLMGGYPFFMDGGYYTSVTEGGGVRVEADLELRETDPGEGETTTRFTADLVFDVEGKTISGTVDVSTQSSTGETNPYLDTSCSFEDRPLDLFVALGKADFNLFERVCPQKWDEEVDLQVRARHKHNGDDDPIHIMGPGEGFDGSTKVRSGGSDGRRYPTTMGETLQFSVGRGEQVFGSASCPPAFHGGDVDVVYDDGWGLNTFSFYCVFKGEPPPIPIVDE
ncbi:MAG: hypothetical protein JRJ84_20995, partial [Deltaproteobacteria bacterium]|nr:hypothetical protein [Deltaproteobacteria bacterium]